MTRDKSPSEEESVNVWRVAHLLSIFLSPEKV